MTDIDYTASRFDHLVLGTLKRGVVLYRCPVCGSKVRNDADAMEPACTGPHPSLDEHPLAPMVKVGVDMERTR